MQSLPDDDFEYADWHLARVGIDYHVEVQGLLYSVPHSLIREQVDTRATARTVEVFHRGKRVAAHARRYGGPRHGTQPEHMPSSHRRYAEWTPERLQRQARGIGPNTEALIIAVLARRPHPEQGFRTCLGVLRLFRGLDAVRVEAVSLRAVEIGALAYASILKHRLDQSALPQAADDTPLRYNAGSLIITSQVPIDRWHDIVGNPTLADAILDRILHNAHRIELRGESMRKRRAAA